MKKIIYKIYKLIGFRVISKELNYGLKEKIVKKFLVKKFKTQII